MPPPCHGSIPSPITTRSAERAAASAAAKPAVELSTTPHPCSYATAPPWLRRRIAAAGDSIQSKLKPWRPVPVPWVAGSQIMPVSVWTIQRVAFACGPIAAIDLPLGRGRTPPLLLSSTSDASAARRLSAFDASVPICASP